MFKLFSINYKVLYLFILLLIFIDSEIVAQINAENNITINNGLINNEVTSIHQDKYGFMWFGTRGGLNKYNSYDFSTIGSNPKSANYLANQAVEAIAEFKNMLWIGNKTGGLNSYNLLTDSITHYTPPKNVNIQEIKSLHVDQTGTLYIGAVRGFYLLRKGKFETIDQNVTVYSITQDKQGNIWAGTTMGLLQYLPKTKKIKQISLGKKTFDITSIAINNQTQTLYLGSWNNGLVKYNINDSSYQKYFNGLTADGLVTKNVYRVFIDKRNTVWAGTWGGGLNKFNEKTGVFERVIIKPYNVFNLDYDIILSIYEDNTGILWIGTDGGGVCKIDPFRKKFKTLSSYNFKSTLPENSHITAILEDNQKSLWLGTKGNGLIYSENKEVFFNIKLGTKQKRINCFLKNDKELWVGTGEGIAIFNDYQKSNQFKTVVYKAKDKTSLSGPKITSLIKDKTNTIWVGTQEQGLNRVMGYKDGEPIFRQYTTQLGIDGAIQNNRISCMLVDDENRLWIGTYDGLHLYNRASDSFRVFKREFGKSQRLSNNTILSIARDSKNNIWVGTQQGLNKLSFNVKGEVIIESFYQSQGFPNDYIHAVLVDLSDQVWMSTNKGITKLDLKNKVFRTFDIRDGISSNTFSENASFNNQKGQLFFGGIAGITYFNPDSIKLNNYEPPLYITGLQINNQKVTARKIINNNVILPKPLFLTNKIELSYEEDIISISYAALDYHASDKNQYQYILEGFDKQWVSAGKNRTITYTSLPSGSYTFKIKSSNSDLIWNSKITSIQIDILPPPWKTWWAYIIYSLMIGGLLYLSRKITLNRIYLKNKLEIANLNYEKEHEIVEIKSKVFTNVSHEFRTPLTLMIGPLEDLVDKEGLDSSTKSVIKNVQNQSKRLLSLVNQLLDFNKAEENSLKLNASYQDIVYLSKIISSSFEDEAKRKHIQFSFKSNVTELYLWIDYDKIESIAYNLLSNAFKFTPSQGEICFEVNYLNSTNPICEFIVADTGRGISKEDKDKIFDRFYQVSQAEAGKYQGTGIGLAFVKDLVELHKGKIYLTDNEPQGSIFKIELLAEEVSNNERINELNEELDIIIGTNEHNLEDSDLPILLVVEDNEELNHYLCSTLNKVGKVISAKDGKEGIEKALATIPDLIVSDVMMPEVDGYELCKTLKENHATSHIPIILLTAKSDDLSHIQGIKLGADNYLAKPFKPALLLSHVQSLILSRKKLKELFAHKLNLEPGEIEVTSYDEEFIKNTIQYIEANLVKEDFSIDELANELNMSRSTFYRKLKALTDMSGSDFIRLIRLKRSAQFLKSGEYTVSTAAYNAGFNDLKHFRKSFQKQFGVNPSDYIKNNIKEQKEH